MSVNSREFIWLTKITRIERRHDVSRWNDRSNRSICRQCWSLYNRRINNNFMEKRNCDSSQIWFFPLYSIMLSKKIYLSDVFYFEISYWESISGFMIHCVREREELTVTDLRKSQRIKLQRSETVVPQNLFKSDYSCSCYTHHAEWRLYGQNKSKHIKFSALHIGEKNSRVFNYLRENLKNGWRKMARYFQKQRRNRNARGTRLWVGGLRPRKQIRGTGVERRTM